MSRVMREAGLSKTAACAGRERFMAEGAAGSCDRTRPQGTPLLPEEQAVEVVRLTRWPPPREATHWTARAMADAVGLIASTVQKIWKALGHGAASLARLKLSTDPAFCREAT